MAHSKLFAQLERLESKYLPMWQEICEIESPTGCKPGVDAVADYCIRHAETMGWDVVRGHEEISGDPVCITMNSGNQMAPICLSAHMDTVHPVGAFGKPAVRIEGDRMVGPGVMDCKGNIIAAMMVMEALQSCGYDKRPVKLILQSDEETGSAGSQKRTVDFMERHAQGCLCFLNMEPHNAGKVTVQRKGILKVRFDITGQAGHAGMCYNFASAIGEAAHKILQVERYKDKDGITCNVGTVSGGTVPNTVPEKCSFTVDVRFTCEEERLRILQQLRQIADTPYVAGTSATLTILSTRLAMPKTDGALALAAKMNEIFEATGLPCLTPTAVAGGSDCADMVSRGILGVDSLGVEGGGLHSLSEWGSLPSLVTCCKRIGALVLYL